MSNGFGDYLVFVDESGDHGLDAIDPGYPMFVLAFCVIRKEDYVTTLTPALQRFKMKHFGHDDVILHEREIRKDQGAFAFLKTREKKQAFLDELTAVVAATPFTLICSVIRKDHLRAKYVDPDNPYHIALGFGLERVFYYLRDKGAVSGKTHVMVEKRGKREDGELELEFRRVCDGGNYTKEQLPFEIAFVDKKSNSAGLQIADLVARPVGMSILRPEQENRAFETLRSKFYARASGGHNGWGVKCFP
ncbi:MAG: DUF3800 domain-containing protein [Sideroxydans sp.]|nr:DUF3800 domain-containing protein [Sideroxydans sp.]